MSGKAAQLFGRCLICLCLPIVCACNVIFAVKFLGEKDWGMNDTAIILVCNVFCLHLAFTACCWSNKEEDDVAEENISKENNESKENIGAHKRMINRSKSCVIDMGF